MPPNPPPYRTLIASTLALFALLAIIAKCAACSPSQVGAGLDVAGHSAALANCRAEGKDAGSYLAYSTCADEVDRRYGLKDAGHE